MNRTSPASTAATNTARLCTRSHPSCAVTGAASPKTPTGAHQSTHQTSLIRVAETASAKVINCCLCFPPSAAAAAPKSAVNTISGSRLPAEAAAKGLGGTRVTRKSTTPGISGAACSPAAGIATSGAKRRKNPMVAMPSTIAGGVVIQ